MGSPAMMAPGVNPFLAGIGYGAPGGHHGMPIPPMMLPHGAPLWDPYASALLRGSPALLPPLLPPPIARQNTAPNLPSPPIQKPRPPAECPTKTARANDIFIEEHKKYFLGREKIELRQRLIDSLPRRQYIPKGYEVDDCGICCIQMRLQDQMIELKCRHMLHIPCISEWLMKDDRCPLCMKPAI